MTIPTGVGAVLAIIIVILCVLGLVGVLPFTPQLVFAMVGVLAIARLC